MWEYNTGLEKKENQKGNSVKTLWNGGKNEYSYMVYGECMDQ